jgi:oxygen-dependent protoporphyrinogen oxidase
MTVTAYQAPVLFAQLDQDRRDIIAGLTYNELWSVALGVDPIPSEPAVFVQIPTVEHPDLDTAVFEHNKAPGRAPAGKGLLNSYWLTHWYRKHTDCENERISALASGERAARITCAGALRGLIEDPRSPEDARAA